MTSLLQKRKSNTTPFRRIKEEEIVIDQKELEDNSYYAKVCQISVVE
jgi:hypothetical protein